MHCLLVMWSKIAPCDKQFCSTLCVSSYFTLFWCKIHFVVIYAVLTGFMHFCVEQKFTHKSCPWSKNDKYHVCSAGCLLSVIPASESSQKNEECVQMVVSGSDSDVCVFLPFVCLLYQHQKVLKRMRKNSTYCVQLVVSDSDSDVCVFLPSVCYASIRKFTKEWGRTLLCAHLVALGSDSDVCVFLLLPTSLQKFYDKK